MEDRRRHVTPSDPRLERARGPRAHRGWRRRCLSLIVVLVLLLSASVASARTQVEEAAALYAAGQYDAAERLLDAALKADASDGDAALALAKIKLRKGAYDDLDALLKQAVKNKSIALEARTIQGELAELRGNNKAARKHYDAVLKKDAHNLRAMLRLGLLLQRSGKNRQAEKSLSGFLELYNNDAATTAESLTYVGQATRALQYYEDANNVFSEASEQDSGYVPTYVEAGFLYLEKYNQRDADEMFRKALETDPNHPMAHVGMARVYLDSDFDFDKATVEVEAALAVNPNLVEAMNIRISMALTDEDTSKAFAEIDRALAINPNHLETLALKAAAHYLADDAKAQRKAEKVVLKLNPRYADLYSTMAHFGEIAHRYEEGIQLYKKALKVDKNYWKAFVGLGIAYTRIGDDKKGQEYLEKAFFNDPYNVRAYNMVELFDKTLKQYEFVKPNDGLRIRLHRDEKDLLSLYVPPLMEGAYNYYVSKYRFTPSKPLSIEIFSDLTSFSVRSVGLPAISPQGICFGKVITARSPAEGNFNWSQVLWHELAHVFHIQLSDSRVPRWFTEGLAEFETVIARKEWQREHEVEIFLALKKNQILGIENLNDGFTHADSVGQIVVAYYQATLVIEYIEETHGFDKLVEMLEAWGKHKTTEEIFTTILATDFKTFDAAFFTWLEKRLSFLDKSFELDIDSYASKPEHYIELATKSPKDPKALAEAGFAKLFQLQVEPARSYLNEALAIDPKAPFANYLGGVLSLREGNYEKALEFYKVLNDEGIDGYTIRSELGFLNLKLGKNDEAIRHYEKAKVFYPNGEEPYRELSKLYLSQNNKLKARPELERLAEINQNDFKSAAMVMELALEDGDHATALRYGQIALDIYPFDKEIHSKIGDVAVKQKDWLIAEREFEAYLTLALDAPLPGYLGLTRVYIETGQKRKATDYLERVRAVDPNHAQLSELSRRVEDM